MAVICPTILAGNAHTYRTQLERIEGFAKRIQVDLTDGIFAPTTTINPVQAYWPPAVDVDIHLMYQEPAEQIEQLIHMGPNMIILHAEAEGNLLEMFTEIAANGIETGVALLKDTTAEDAVQYIELVDHVLIFSGSLGQFGGSVDESLFSKVRQVKEINPAVEVGWDGGANAENALSLIRAGIDVINVGGYIQKAEDPQAAYDIITAKIHQ